MSPDDGQSVEALLVRSDDALYRAKQNRGGYVFADDPLQGMGGSYQAADSELAA